MSADKGLLRTLQLAELESWLKEAETKVPFYDYTDEEKDALKSQIIKRLSVDFFKYNEAVSCISKISLAKEKYKALKTY